LLKSLQNPVLESTSLEQSPSVGSAVPVCRFCSNYVIKELGRYLELFSEL
ncbi:15591_t:CDS:1, partial [Dentiscutata heterogama]